MLQTKVTQVYDEVIVNNIGYQYDSRDKEVFLESGYEYVLVSIVDNQLRKVELDLTEELNAN